MSENFFPSELLDKSPLERLAYFRTYTVLHPILKEIYSKLIRTIKEPAGTSLIFIYGATGIGKTTLSLQVEKLFKEESLTTTTLDPGCIPIVGIESVSPDSGSFSWKDFYKRALIALEEPLINCKINYGEQKVFRTGESLLQVNHRSAGSELRYALENALKYRKPAAVLIDEAQHIAKIASGRKLQDQLDSLKSLANLSGVILVLFGTYELLEARNLSAQLSRRSLDLHFKRYSITLPEDAKIFRNIVFTFQHHLPLKQMPDLMSHWQYLFERSLGCVGILKDWLTRSYAVSLEEQAETITLKHLEQEAMVLAQCRKVAEKIAEGEAQLAEKEEDRTRLLSILGLTNELNKQSKTTISKVNQVATIKEKKARLVGRRKPKRDGIG